MLGEGGGDGRGVINLPATVMIIFSSNDARAHPLFLCHQYLNSGRCCTDLRLGQGHVEWELEGFRRGGGSDIEAWCIRRLDRIWAARDGTSLIAACPA